MRLLLQVETVWTVELLLMRGEEVGEDLALLAFLIFFSSSRYVRNLIDRHYDSNKLLHLLAPLLQ